MKRRTFIKLSLITSTILTNTKITASSKIQNNTKKSNILILGGGFAGISTAKYLKQLNPNLNVTLVEKNNTFISCPFSNAWIGEIEGITYESLCFDYNSSILKHKYNFINETIIDINKKEKIVTTHKSILEYDFLVMTLGIDYNYKKILKKSKEKIKEVSLKAPAALKPGSELIKLKKMITDFKGGNFVITLPRSSYKCPPAPYERACMIANYFKKNKINGKVILIDPRAKPASKANIYLEAFNNEYKEFIEYKPLTNFKDIDFRRKKIYTKHFNEKLNKYMKNEIDFNEASIIPPNRANRLYKKANIEMYTQGWVKLRKPTYQTITDSDIYVIGDAQGEYPFPKSAQMANSCALVLAKDIDARIRNQVFDYKRNLPGNVCYSIISENKGAWVSHNYKYEDKMITFSKTSNLSKNNFIAAKDWYSSFTKELF
ncbi:MAG: hypothetical protein C0625_17195 [Arcobacter sp.]|nr:MAG: hypothetical protein C0625_17195 [Arcobacter sp.]